MSRSSLLECRAIHNRQNWNRGKVAGKKDLLNKASEKSLVF